MKRRGKGGRRGGKWWCLAHGRAPHPGETRAPVVEGLRIAPGGGSDSHREAAAVSARREPLQHEACRDHRLVGAAGAAAAAGGGPVRDGQWAQVQPTDRRLIACGR